MIVNLRSEWVTNKKFFQMSQSMTEFDYAAMRNISMMSSIPCTGRGLVCR